MIDLPVTRRVTLVLSILTAVSIAGCDSAANDGRAYHRELSERLLDPAGSGTQIERGNAPHSRIGQTVEFGIRLAPGGEGVHRTGDRFRPASADPTANADGIIYANALSAEQFVGVEGAAFDSIARDDGASGGQYADTPLFLSIPFYVDQTADYGIWLRIREIDDTESRFYWTIDSGRRWHVSRQEDGKKNQWRWVNLGQQRMGAGQRRFVFQRHGAPRWHIDALAIVPAGQQPAEAPPFEFTTAKPATMRVVSEPVTPPAIERLSSLTLPHADGQRAINLQRMTIEASPDGGVTWIEAPGGDLSAIPVKGDGTDSFTFRVTLPQIAPGDSEDIIADGFRLSVVPKPNGWLAAENDFVRVLIDARTGRLFRITDVARRREILWPNRPETLFTVDLKKLGQSQWLRYSDERAQWIRITGDARQVELAEDIERAEGLGHERAEAAGGATAEPAVFEGGESDGGRIALNYVVDDRIRLRLRIELNDSGQMLWHADIVNEHEALDVVRLEFPRFAAIRLGANGFDDSQFRPQTHGHFRRAPGLNPLRAAKYPGAMAMPWESIYDDEGGFAVTVHDPHAINVGFEPRETGHFADTLDLSVRKYHCIPHIGADYDAFPAETPASWTYAVAVHPGRWHWPADRYREWAMPHMVRPPYPDWFAASDGYASAMLQLHTRPFDEIGYLGHNARLLGLKHVQAWGQFTGWPRGGCCGPYWQPSPQYGSLDDFKKGIADIQSHGARVGFFFLHDRIDLYHPEGSHIYGMIPKTDYPPGTEFPTPEFHNRLQWVSDPSGKPTAYPLSEEQWDTYRKGLAAYKENPEDNAPPRLWHPVDLSDPEWWEYMRRWAIDKYVETWGANGHYYDVLGCGQARESFDLRKNHHGHGLWGVGRKGIPRTTMESAIARGHRDYFLLMEGMCDVPGQWTAGMISGIYHGQSEAMRYTWPDFIIFEGHANTGHHRPFESLEPAFLNGNRFDLSHQTRPIAELTALRAATRPWIYRARFMDTLGLYGDALHSDFDWQLPYRAEREPWQRRTLRARIFVRRDAEAEGLAITVVNPEGDEGVIEVDLARHGFANIERAFVFDQTGRAAALPLRPAGKGRVAFDAPTEHFNVVVLPARVSGVESLAPLARLVREEGVARIRLTMVNMSGAPASGHVAVRDFGPFDTPAINPVFAVPPYGITHIDLPIDEGPDFWEPHRLAFDIVSAGGVSQRVECAAYPLAEDPSFARDGNDTDTVLVGERSFRMDPSEGTNLNNFRMHLEPSRRYRISFAYKRTEGAAGNNSAQVWQRLGTRQEVNRKGFSLPVANRWERAEIVFDSAPRFISTSLYVYNMRSERTVWFDDIRIEDLGPISADTP